MDGRGKHILGSAVIACMVVLTVQTWFVTAGTWHTLPAFPYPYEHYYNQLADAFLKGQTHLEEPVNPLLLELPNPYDPEARGNIDFLWDTSLYQGKYYLYWGPMPSLILMVIKLIHPMEIGDHLIVFAGVALTTIFQTLLLTLLWVRYFQRLPIWTLFTGIVMAGLIVPFNLMNNRPEIYEGAIISGQVFLIGGVYFALLAIQPNEVSPRLLAVAAILWGCAVASRTIIALEVIFASALIVLLILNHPGTWAGSITRIMMFGLPLALFALGLGVYNFVRFGSVFEFGFRHQLTMFDFTEHGDKLFSTRYILPNIEAYVLTAPQRVDVFPYVRVKEGDEVELQVDAPDFYYIEKTTGLIYTFPFAVFALVPFFRTVIKKAGLWKNTLNMDDHMLQWSGMLLSGIALIAIGQLLTFFYATMRYLADATPTLSILAIMGFWLGYQAISSNRFLCFAYSCIGIVLAGITIIFPNMLALLASERFETFSPKVLPAIDLFFRTLLLG